MGGWQSYPIGLNQTISGHEREARRRRSSRYVQHAYAAQRRRLRVHARPPDDLQRGALPVPRGCTKGRPGDLFGTPGARHPRAAVAGRHHRRPALARSSTTPTWPATPTSRSIGRRLVVLRPDWVTLVVGSHGSVQIGDLDAESWWGYIYYPGGEGSGREPVLPAARPVRPLRAHPRPGQPVHGHELADARRHARSPPTARPPAHKLKFFENGATVNLVLKADPLLTTPEAFEKWVAMSEQAHRGVANAYKTLYLQSGADAKAIGADMQQIEFKATQGAGETRIAAASGIHPVIVGLSEGMQGSSLNAGNFNSARRLVADKTMRPLWRNIAGSLESHHPGAARRPALVRRPRHRLPARGPQGRRRDRADQGVQHPPAHRRRLRPAIRRGRRRGRGHGPPQALRLPQRAAAGTRRQQARDEWQRAARRGARGAADRRTSPMPDKPPRDNIVRAVFPGAELREAEDGGMPTLTGHFAVFDQWAAHRQRLRGPRSWSASRPVRSSKTIAENRDQMRVLFNHGKDPHIGDKPLGPIERARGGRARARATRCRCSTRPTTATSSPASGPASTARRSASASSRTTGTRSRSAPRTTPTACPSGPSARRASWSSGRSPSRPMPVRRPASAP